MKNIILVLFVGGFTSLVHSSFVPPVYNLVVAFDIETMQTGYIHIYV